MRLDGGLVRSNRYNYPETLRPRAQTANYEIRDVLTDDTLYVLSDEAVARRVIHDLTIYSTTDDVHLYVKAVAL